MLDRRMFLAGASSLAVVAALYWTRWRRIGTRRRQGALVLKGAGGATRADDMRCDMYTGDVILTPI